MRDATSGKRISGALSHILIEISNVSNARLGAICNLAPSGLLRLLAVQSAAQSGSVPQSIVTIYDPAMVLNSTITERIQIALKSPRPRVVILPRKEMGEFVTSLGEYRGHATDNSILVIPSQSGSLGILLVGPTPWDTPSLSYLRTKFDQATYEYDFLSGATTTDQITRLLVELSSAVSESNDSRQGAQKLSQLIGSYFGYTSASSFSVEDGRLLPISISADLRTDEPIPVSLHPSFFNGLYKVALRAFESRGAVSFTAIGDYEFPETVRKHLGLSGQCLVLPMLRGDNHIGVLVLGSPLSEDESSIFENASTTVLMRHISLLFAQLIEDHEKDVRLRAISSITPMLDATTQIISREEMGNFLAESISMSTAASRAMFFLLNDQKYVTSVCPAGNNAISTVEMHKSWIGRPADGLPFYSHLTSSHEPLFFEPSMPDAYPREIRELIGESSYVVIPISTSDGLIGFALAAQPIERPFWTSFDKATAIEWSVSATLVADNVGLRLAERSHLESYREKAFKDSLTGLPNRELFLDRLQVATIKAQRTHQRTAVIFIDIDLFKQVNDSYNHKTGDELLVQFARRLTTAFRDTDTVARLSGDEFVILVENSPPEDELVDVARRAFEHLNDTYTIFNHEINITISMGIAIGQPGMDGSELLERADEYMYRSKGAGRGRVSVYSPNKPDDRAAIDLRSTDPLISQGKGLSARTHRLTMSDFDFSDEYVRFSADYVELARLRIVLANIVGGRHSLFEEAKVLKQETQAEYALDEYADLRTEFVAIRPTAGKSSETNKPTEILNQLLNLDPRGIKNSNNFPRKILIMIDGLAPDSVVTFGRMIAEFKSIYGKTPQLLLGISSTQLESDPGFLISMSTLAVKYRCEIMITDLQHRSLKFHDLLMPMVNYVAMSGEVAERDSRLTAPNSLSALCALARDRGIRIVAQGLSSASALDALLLAGVTVVSGPALGLVRTWDKSNEDRLAKY